MSHQFCPRCHLRVPHFHKFCYDCGYDLGSYQRTPLESILEKWGERPAGDKTIPPEIRRGIVEECEKNWDIICQRQTLTWYLVHHLFTIRADPEIIPAALRERGDSRPGGIFKDKIEQLLECYLQSQSDLYLSGRHFPFILKRRFTIRIPPANWAKPVDLAIFHEASATPLIVLELKTSFAPHSIIKYYTKMVTDLSALSPAPYSNILFFSCSPKKTETYRETSKKLGFAIPWVICYDFKPTPISNQRPAIPKIRDPIEHIFEAIKAELKKR